MRPWALASCAALVVGAPSSAHADAVRASTRLEFGVEHDSNPTRRERVEGAPAPVGGSALARTTAFLDVAVPIAAGHSLDGSAGVAGKSFFNQDARLEDVVVAQGQLGYGAFLGPRTLLSVRAGYYDVFQRADGLSDARDFRSLAPTARLERLLGPARLSVAGGYRHFTFKPTEQYSFSGPTAGVALGVPLPADPLADSADWDLSFASGVEWRAYSGAPCTSEDTCLPADSGTRRRDVFWTAAAEVTRTGAVLLGAGASAHFNRSNSYGEQVARALGQLRFGALLPWSVSVSARAEVIFTRYKDRLSLARDSMTGTPLVSIEDESRSTLRFEVVRPVVSVFEVGVRYVYYTSALTRTRVDFSRQTAMLFLAASWDR